MLKPYCFFCWVVLEQRKQILVLNLYVLKENNSHLCFLLQYNQSNIKNRVYFCSIFSIFSLMMSSQFDINYIVLLINHGATRNNRTNQVLSAVINKHRILRLYLNQSFSFTPCESYTSHSHSLCFCSSLPRVAVNPLLNYTSSLI